MSDPHTFEYPDWLREERAAPGPTVAELKATYYNPRAWFLFRWGAKCGLLSLYVYAGGCGWTWDCGYGRELHWSRRWPWLRIWIGKAPAA